MPVSRNTESGVRDGLSPMGGLGEEDAHSGHMYYRFEEPLHRFQNTVIDKMVGIDCIPPGDEYPGHPLFISGD